MSSVTSIFGSIWQILSPIFTFLIPMSAGAGARATTGIFQRLPNSVGQVLTAAYFKGKQNTTLVKYVFTLDRHRGIVIKYIKCHQHLSCHSQTWVSSFAIGAKFDSPPHWFKKCNIIIMRVLKWQVFKYQINSGCKVYDKP